MSHKKSPEDQTVAIAARLPRWLVEEIDRVALAEDRASEGEFAANALPALGAMPFLSRSEFTAARRAQAANFGGFSRVSTP